MNNPVQNETQQTVTQWANRHYPDENLNHAILGLIEEAAELAVATGAITREDAHARLDRVWDDIGHLPKADEHIQSGIADVQICLYAVAGQTGHDVQTCLNWKMGKNRLRIV